MNREEMLNSVDKKIDLLSDIQHVIFDCIRNNNGVYKITESDAEILTGYIASKIGNYTVAYKDFLFNFGNVYDEYDKFFKMYHAEHKEFRDYKMLAEKRVKRLKEDRRMFLELLKEKSKEVDVLKKKLEVME